MIFDVNQARTYIEALTGSANTVVTWQVFYDPKEGIKRPDLASHFQATLDQAIPAIKRAEMFQCGVYICINESDGKGRHEKNIQRIRTVFADFDGMAEPVWPITPHLITKRDETHGHAYWFVDDCAVEDFAALQKRIAIVMNTDHQVVDPCRVARVPGTAHLKNPTSPMMYRVVQRNEGGAYKSQNIIDGFVIQPDKIQEYERWVNSRNSHDFGSGFDDNANYIKKFVVFITGAAEPAVEGEGTATLIRVAGMAHDLGLHLETCQNLMWEHYNPRCEPPWSDDEQNHFNDVIERAYLYAKNEPGCRTAKAAFHDAPEITPPPPIKSNTETVRVGDRIERDRATIMIPMLTAKSSHYELAQAFDGVIYDGTDIVRCRKIFYMYNGRSWSINDDEMIKASIQRFFAKYKPSDTLVRGIYNSFCDLIAVRTVDNGIWLDSGKHADGVVCFKNGLVDLTEAVPQVIDHTPNFFCFNELDYDYVPGAKCPEWLSFLDSVWGDDQELKDQLQEWFGYCLVNETDLQKFAVLIGKPRAGKGVIGDTLSNMLGVDNTVAPSLSKFTNDSTLFSMSTASVALVPDAHSVHASKRDEVLSNLKAITGGDSLDYHVMYKGTQTSKFKTRVVLSTNNMPQFLDASGALAARMLIFPFEKSFVGKEDYTLKDRILKEVSGVAQWALEGLKRLKMKGRFTEAASGLAVKEDVKDEMNPMSDFISDIIDVVPTAFTESGKLYRVYQLWCKQTETMPMSKINLCRILSSSDLPIKAARTTIEGRSVRGFSGLSVVKFPDMEVANDG